MPLRYATLLIVSAVLASCDLAQSEETDEPETTILGFWKGTGDRLEGYQFVSPTEVSSYSQNYSDRSCFDKSVKTVSSMTDTRVEGTSPPYGVRFVIQLDTTNTNRMSYTVVGNGFQYDRAGRGDRSRGELEGALCDG